MVIGLFGLFVVDVVLQAEWTVVNGSFGLPASLGDCVGVSEGGSDRVRIMERAAIRVNRKVDNLRAEGSVLGCTHGSGIIHGNL